MVEASLLNTVETAGILIGIGIALFQLREFNTTKKKELTLTRLQTSNLEYYDTFVDVYNMEWNTVEEFFEKYGIRNNPRAYAKWLFLMFRFQGIGSMLKGGVVDPDHFFEVYSPRSFLRIWTKYKPVIMYYRDQTRNPATMGNVEYLANAVMERYPEMPERSISYPHTN
jgi:hypothetical protein